MAMHFRASNITTGSAHALLTLVSKLNAELTRLHREVKSKSDKRGLIADSNDASEIICCLIPRQLRNTEESRLR